MNDELKKIEQKYFKMSKLVAGLFILLNYAMWTSPFSLMKAIVIWLLVMLVTFVFINILDLLIGIARQIIKCVARKVRNRKILKDFYGG